MKDFKVTMKDFKKFNNKKKILLLFIFTFGCKKTNNEVNQGGDWIKGSEVEQIKIIEKQFRGFDNTMVEVGYRYQELFWAGKDKNWGYANYQLDKIKLTIENGIQRRPKRKNSADFFLNQVLPQIKKSIERKDSYLFNKEFNSMTINCNSCHIIEKVSFFNVQIPSKRQSPIRI